SLRPSHLPPTVCCLVLSTSCFFFTAPPTPETYTLSLHDALPISGPAAQSPRARSEPTRRAARACRRACTRRCQARRDSGCGKRRSEEHTSELQSRSDLVCRLLLEKKKKQKKPEQHRILTKHTPDR